MCCDCKAEDPSHRQFKRWLHWFKSQQVPFKLEMLHGEEESTQLPQARREMPPMDIVTLSKAAGQPSFLLCFSCNNPFSPPLVVRKLPSAVGGSCTDLEPAAVEQIEAKNASESHNGRNWKGPLEVIEFNPLTQAGSPKRAF